MRSSITPPRFARGASCRWRRWSLAGQRPGGSGRRSCELLKQGAGGGNGGKPLSRRGVSVVDAKGGVVQPGSEGQSPSGALAEVVRGLAQLGGRFLARLVVAHGARSGFTSRS